MKTEPDTKQDSYKQLDVVKEKRSNELKTKSQYKDAL